MHIVILYFFYLHKLNSKLLIKHIYSNNLSISIELTISLGNDSKNVDVLEKIFAKIVDAIHE